jgi:hypothetical protein
MSSETLILLAEFFVPLIALVIYARWKVTRDKRAKEGLPTPPFAPEPEPTPNAFLRRFTLPQRTWIRQQIAYANIFFRIGVWIYTIAFTACLLPGFINRYGTQLTRPQRVWNSFLRGITDLSTPMSIIMVLAAFVAVAALAAQPQASITRTRPLSLPFLFWTRILAAIATILASLTTAMTLCFALLLVFYGPVWRHLSPPSAPLSPPTAVYLGTLNPALSPSPLPRPPVVNLGTPYDTSSPPVPSRTVIRASAPRLFLSLASTSLLTFSFVVMACCLHFRFHRPSSSPGTVTWIGILIAIFFLNSMHHRAFDFLSRPARILFLYSSLGPPPPYAFLAVPLCASAALLFLAAFFHSRLEP